VRRAVCPLIYSRYVAVSAMPSGPSDTSCCTCSRIRYLLHRMPTLHDSPFIIELHSELSAFQMAYHFLHCRSGGLHKSRALSRLSHSGQATQSLYDRSLLLLFYFCARTAVTRDRMTLLDSVWCRADSVTSCRSTYAEQYVVFHRARLTK
jgi:hypothetical protein